MVDGCSLEGKWLVRGAAAADNDADDAKEAVGMRRCGRRPGTGGAARGESRCCCGAKRSIKLSMNDTDDEEALVRRMILRWG